MYGFCLIISSISILCCPDRPVCDNRTVAHSKIAVSASSASIVDCFLDANPAATQVYWISSRQGHQAKLDPTHYTLMDGFSRLSYKPDRCLETDHELIRMEFNNI